MKRYDWSYYSMIRSWYEERGLPYPQEKDLPRTGFVIPEVAAGFLIKTDTSACILDFFITNKFSRKDDRNTALDCIIKSLIQSAKDSGFTRIIAESKIDTIKSRAISCGFRSVGYHSVFAKEI